MSFRDRPAFDRPEPSAPGPSAKRRFVMALFGIILFPLSIIILVANELSSAQTSRSLIEVASLVHESSSDRVDSALEGKLVHLTGPLTVPGILADPDFPIIAPGAVQLRRSVSTYQWKEEAGGRTASSNFVYRAIWTEQPIDSSTFHQPGAAQNPPPHFASRQQVSPEAYLGAFRLTDSLLRTLPDSRAVALTDAVVQPGTRLDGNAIYVGTNPRIPQIGDQRLVWEVVETPEVSVIARQHGADLIAYPTEAGDEFQLIRPGLVEANNMVTREQQENDASSWMGRVVGAATLFAASCLLLPSITSSLSVTKLKDNGTPIAAGLLTMVLAPIVIGLARLAAEQKGGIAALALGVALGILLFRRARTGGSEPGTRSGPC